MGRLLTRDEILRANDLIVERVPVPEWGENAEVLVRGLSAADQLEMASVSFDGQDAERSDTLKLMIKIPARCIVDENGRRLFTDDDIDALGEKSRTALQRIMETAMRLSDLEVDAAKKG